MRKIINIILLCIMMLCSIAFISCDEEETATPETTTHTHTYVEHSAVSATCNTLGNELYFTCSECDKLFDANKNEIQSIPYLQTLSHDFVLHEPITATCKNEGSGAYYTCSKCSKIFNLKKVEISSIPQFSYDKLNHEGSGEFSIDVQNVKTEYKSLEKFNPVGLKIKTKCDDCEGEIIDNQYLSFTYQSYDDCFKTGDTKVEIYYGNDHITDIDVSVSKIETEINIENSYNTTCKKAPNITYTSNVSKESVQIKYYNGEEEILASQLLAGNSYTAKLIVADSDDYSEKIVSTTINVNHEYVWKNDSSDSSNINHICNCGNSDIHLLNNKQTYVDSDDLGIDLSKFIVGTVDYSITDVKKIVDDEETTVAYTHIGNVYTFNEDVYDDSNGSIKKVLRLAVTYRIGDSEDKQIYINSGKIDKVIKTKEDLKLLGYTGGTDKDHNSTVDNKYYALANDIDASGLELDTTTLCYIDDGAFRGVFDGNGYTISNLYINKNYGLFGSIGADAVIKNVTFENAKLANEWCYFFGYTIRTNSKVENVEIEFTNDSGSFTIFNSKAEATADTFTNVIIHAKEGYAIIGDMTSFEGITVEIIEE